MEILPGDFVWAQDPRHGERVVGRVLRLRGVEAHVAWHARAGHVEEQCIPTRELVKATFPVLGKAKKADK